MAPKKSSSTSAKKTLAAKEKKKYPIVRHLSPNIKELFLQHVEPFLETYRLKELLAKAERTERTNQFMLDNRKRKLSAAESQLSRAKHDEKRRSPLTDKIEKGRAAVQKLETASSKVCQTIEQCKVALVNEEKNNPPSSLFDPIAAEEQMTTSGPSGGARGGPSLLCQQPGRATKQPSEKQSKKMRPVPSTASFPISTFLSHQDMLAVSVEFMSTNQAMSLAMTNQGFKDAVPHCVTAIILGQPTEAEISVDVLNRFSRLNKIDVTFHDQKHPGHESLLAITTISNRITEFKTMIGYRGYLPEAMFRGAVLSVDWPALKSFACSSPARLFESFIGQLLTKVGNPSRMEELSGNWDSEAIESVGDRIRQGKLPALRRVLSQRVSSVETTNYCTSFKLDLRDARDAENVTTILGQARDTTSLEIGVAYDGHLQSIPSPQPAGIFSHLRRLKLSDSCSTLSDLCQVGVAPLLEELELSDSCVKDYDPTIDFHPGSLPSLCSLSLQVDRSTSSEAVNGVLLAAGPHLKQLSVHSYGEWTTKEKRLPFELFNMIANEAALYSWKPNLESLSLKLALSKQLDQIQMFQVCKKMLMALPSLQEIVSGIGLDVFLIALLEAKEAGTLTNLREFCYQEPYYYTPHLTDIAALLLVAWLKEERPGGPSQGLANFQVINVRPSNASIRSVIANIGLPMLSLT